MKCYNCRHLLPDDSEFCQYCGAKIEQLDNAVINTETGETIKKCDDEQVDIVLSGDSVNNLNSKKTKKSTKKAFCGVCGSAIDKENKKCTSCGKQYFRGIRLKPLLNCIFCVIILVSLFFNIMQYINYIDLVDEKYNVAIEKQGLEKEVKKLKESVSSEYDKGYDAGYSKGYSKGKSQSTVVTKPSITYSYSYDEDESCAIPGCSRSPQRNSFYCFSHECMKAGCHNRKANDFCSYCVNHKCAMSNCNSSQAYNSIYCYRHK